MVTKKNDDKIKIVYIYMKSVSSHNVYIMSLEMKEQ